MLFFVMLGVVRIGYLRMHILGIVQLLMIPSIPSLLMHQLIFQMAIMLFLLLIRFKQCQKNDCILRCKFDLVFYKNNKKKFVYIIRLIREQTKLIIKMTQLVYEIGKVDKSELSVYENSCSTIQDLKRHFQQNNLLLYNLQEETRQSLLDVLADYCSITPNQLHLQLSNKLRELFEQNELTGRLTYISKDEQIVRDYEKDSNLVSFYKVTYQLVCLMFQVRIMVYTLVGNPGQQSCLNAMIINPNGVDRDLKIARVDNYFFRVQQQFIQHFSLNSIPSSLKSSNNLNSQQRQQKQFIKLRQPFHSQKIIVEIDEKQLRSMHLTPQFMTETIRTQQQHIIRSIKKGKSVNFNQPDFINSRKQLDDNDDVVSIGNILDKKQQQQLLNKCSNVADSLTDPKSKSNLNIIHQNNHMAGNMVHPNEMMYYWVLAQPQEAYVPAYSGKSQPYLPYKVSMSPGKALKMPIVSGTLQMSPSKSPIQFDTATASLSNPAPIPLQLKQGQRYLGRLKFFDQGKNYGFIIMDADQSDLFVHFDDLQKAGISKEKIRAYKQVQGYMMVRFSFKVMEYFGKYRQSRKAVELIVIEEPVLEGLV